MFLSSIIKVIIFRLASPISLTTSSDSEVLARIKLLEENVTSLQLDLVRTCVMPFLYVKYAKGSASKPSFPPPEAETETE